MIQKIKNIREKIEEEFDNVNNLEELEEIRIKYLGKKGKISKIFSAMSEVEDEKKPIVGRETNQLKQKIEKLHKEKEDLLDKLHKKEKLKEEQIDVTLPGIKPEVGHAHPLTLVIEEVIDLFAGMGFTIEEGPEVESEYYNFEALNIPKGHPARDLQDTFYIDNKFLLRTHTSPVQVRTMENKDLPIRIIAPGRAYRSDELDASHSPMFHQIEGLVIDHDISFSDLKGSINTFVHKLYGEKRKIRFRPSYFPFTEPSAEVDVSCVVCDGKGCKLCSNTGWLEIMGSGMVHPNVLRMSNIDPQEYSGFAFGMGWDRIVMLKYGIEDIRLLFENDKRFLHQF
ncbi:MAG: phenylalanine--tRNA ligase subunit alpha [Halanaerobiales bacterium]